MTKDEILRSLDKTVIEQSNIELDTRWGKNFNASVSKDYQNGRKRISGKQRSYWTALKVIGLLVMMGVFMVVDFEQLQYGHFLAQRPILGPIMGILFIAIIPITFIQILKVTTGHGLEVAKYTNEVEDDEDDPFKDDDYSFKDDPIMNIDGSPMIDGVDTNGNSYGITND